ncbi:hypothetical protein FHS56_000505 [Thermonema lapsum]|jgi:hypothetical protein|uniref:HTH OST-type domain-containing protein n=1 Tax=Thermonema lapsum TaxID=28195 RepID=A0A846MNH5_9BACT|nr:hypothetical protein [Thermonema lapsum]NIK73019.1 hypothetical protein [Thermonema lapsum]
MEKLTEKKALEIERILKEAVMQCTRADGWANLAEVGGVLRSKGIQYGKLSRFVSNYPHLVELKLDTSISPPAVYARLKKK